MLAVADAHKALLQEALQASGELVLPAQGRSMAPSLRPGDRLVLAPLPPQGPQLGQVVALWQEGGGILAHRVIELVAHESGRQVRTKGDAKRLADPPVPLDQVIGQVVAYERHGQRHPLAQGLRSRWQVWRGHQEDRANSWGLGLLGFASGIEAEALAVLSLAAYSADLLASPALPRRLNWDRVFQLARAGRLTPLLTAKAIPGAPEAFTQACWADRREAEARALLLELAWSELAPALESHGVPCLLVKGPAVAEACYALPGWRPMVDLDLVVPEDRWTEAVAALRSVGFEAEEGRWATLSAELTGQEAFAKAYGRQVAVVELHRDLRMVSERMGPASGAVDIQRAWADAVPFRFAHTEAHTLGKEDALAYACTHWLQHHAPASIWLVDLAVMAQQSRLDWGRLVRQSQEDGTAHALWAGLAAAAAFLHAPVPAWVLSSLAPPSWRGRMAWLALAQVVPSRFGERVDRHSIMLQLAVLPSLPALLRALWRGAWPSAAWLAQQAEAEAESPSVQGPWRLRARYASRLFHLAAKR